MASNFRKLPQFLVSSDETLPDNLREALNWPGVDGLTLEDIQVARADQAIHVRAGDDSFKLARWLVSFDSGSGWYPVGEFLALDAASAIERAIEVFGTGGTTKAEEISWDALPLFH